MSEYHIVNYADANKKGKKQSNINEHERYLWVREKVCRYSSTNT